ncbi:hypothetical protein [Nonomuraea sp. NPDC052265]|uniref:hypothetical protein n=1 Tax=Nonomuraea sp. NPDC052265 TaxID=3364374 RepID=UPI0037C925B3
MDNHRNGIAGFRLTEHTWMTELGNWIDAISPDGRRAGALLFDPRVIGLPGVRERVVSTVMTDQHLVLGGLGGLIPVADVVAAGDQVWLLTAQAVSPTLADLLAGAPIDPAGAASVLMETGQTLLALHAAGVTHGSVHPGTVVITAEGAALLSERGLSDAIRGQISPRERDAAGWASLARGLAASFTQTAPRAAGLFERAAGTATTLGLDAARAMLHQERAALPGGLISRDALARAARGRSAFAQAPSFAAQPPPVPQDEGDIVTLLRVPSSGSPPRLQFGPGVGPGAGAGAGAGAGSAGTAQQPRQETTAERIWREGRDGAATVHQPEKRSGGRVARVSRRRRRRTILSTALFAVVMAGAIVAWFRLTDVPELAVQSIDVVAPKKTLGCGGAIVLTGTVVTNGGVGEIRYEWRKNLDKEVVKGSLRTSADKTSYSVPLRWTLSGKSNVKATATLKVLSPGPARTDKASFTYKC